MIEIKSGIQVDSTLQQFREIRQSLTNSATPVTWQHGQDYLLKAVETMDALLGHSFVDGHWHEKLYSNGYWAIRDLNDGDVRPLPLLWAEAGRLVRWLDEVERELKRIAEQDEWDKEAIPRLLFDTSALVREGSFDTFDWSGIAKDSQGRVRLIIPILVVRELDDLKNFGKSDKARPRLRKIFRLLEDNGRGPTQVSEGTTIELLMDPPGHLRLTSNDQEIVRRASYISGRSGGPVTIVSGDYTMLATAQADGIAVIMTPEELKITTDG